MNKFKVAEIPIIVMGVSGCGKSSMAKELAERLERKFFEGDDLHPICNITKMASGTPLDDEDRASWLGRIALLLRSDRSAIISCSALKANYRNQLRQGASGPVVFVYLRVSRSTIADRLSNRTGHFMPQSLIDSQFETLEEPQNEADVVIIESSLPSDKLANHVMQRLLAWSAAFPVGSAVEHNAKF